MKSPDGITQVLASDKFTLLTCISFKLVRYHCFNKINSLVLLVQDNILELEVWSEKAMAPHSSTLAWKIPWTEEPVRLQSMGSLRVGHD